MPKQNQAVLAKAKVALADIVDYSTLLSKLALKDRTRFEQQVPANGPGAAGAFTDLWRRFCCVMLTLASNPPKLTAGNAAQFFIPDGKYRKQMFAMYAAGNGVLAIYVPDILDVAISTGLIGKPSHTNGQTAYPLAHDGETLMIDCIDGKTPNPEFFFKDMTGWNRKALRISLPLTASPAQIQVVEQLCALASLQWAVVAV